MFLMEFIFIVCTFTKNMLFYKYFSRFLLRFGLKLSIKRFLIWYLTNFCFPKSLLVAAANRFKIQNNYFPKSYSIYTGLQTMVWESLKMPRVSNGNLIVLKWKNIHAISNIKYTAIYSKTWPSSLLYIQQRRIQNPFQRLSKEVILLEVTILKKTPS